jgi:hypothetical protein
MRGLLLAAVGGHLEEGERLELESHLESCSACRGEHASFEGLRRLKGWEPPELAPSARARVQEALRSAPLSRDALVGRVARPSRLFVAVAAALLFAGVGTLWRLRPTRVLDGDVWVAPSAWWGIPDGARLVSRRGGRVALRGPVVALEPGTEVRWDAAAATVALTTGAVDVEVDPARHGSFHVSTPRFSVEVVGTLFRVDADSVRTDRGTVRVVDPAGATLAVVMAGESWRFPRLAERVEAAGTGAVAMGTGALSPGSSPLTPAAHSPRAPLPADARVAPPVDGEALAAARRALAQGDAVGARAVLSPLLRGPPLSAEANMLWAESFLVEADYPAALLQYEVVVREFEGTPQAESALYAAAELEVEHASRDDAVRALARYLETYPRGRFAAEVRAQLESMGGAARP